MDFYNQTVTIYDGVFEQSFCNQLISEFEYRSKLKKTKRDPYFVEKLDLDDEWQMDIHDVIYAYLDDYKTKQWVERDYENYMKDSSILKYVAGDMRWMHAGEPKDRELITLSTLVFLNDDYEGGELRFKDWDHTIHPRAGRLVIFPSCYLFPHEVTMVESGERYTLTTAYGYKVLGPNTGHSITQDMHESAKKAKENFLERRKQTLD